MNNFMIKSDDSWANSFDFDLIGEDVFRTAIFTLNYIFDNRKDSTFLDYIFSAINEAPTYPQRILFHAATTFIFNTKGVYRDGFKDWMRIIRNLVNNTRIDEYDLYRRAIEGINSINNYCENLLGYLSSDGSLSGFNAGQLKEEQIKAKLIIKCDDFAEEIYKAESHPYFAGQIRSALDYSKITDPELCKNIFVNDWNKVSSLFSDNSPKNAELLRRALLTFGDYTMSVGPYKTLCVDDSNESARTPSMKSLFSKREDCTLALLAQMDLKSDPIKQLESIVANSDVPPNDWRYCFVKFPRIFDYMGNKHLRLREVDDEIVMIRNMNSSGLNVGVFIAALEIMLKDRKIDSTVYSELGTWAERWLETGNRTIKYISGIFEIRNGKNEVEHRTNSTNPLEDACDYNEDEWLR